MVKWDGHTHSQFCRHGSGEKTSLMIEKAIGLGFEKYSITEHAPMPSQVIPDPEMRADFGLTWDELDDYFAHLEDLKKRYRNKIELLAGLEIDYLVGMEDYSKDLLDRCQPYLDDVIVSLHFIKDNEKLLPIDYSPETFTNLIDYFGTVDKVHLAYWETMKELVANGLPGLKNKRIGHIALIDKFSKIYPPTISDYRTSTFFKDVFSLIKKYGWSIDFDVAGLNYDSCQEVYLPDYMLHWCKQLDIDLVYGSDAHSVKAVGNFYSLYETMIGHN
jgi:histidinol-phosphatase (PHP family)